MPEPVPDSTSSAAGAPAGPVRDVHGRVYQVLVWGMASSTILFAVGVLLALLRHETVPLSTKWIQAQYAPPVLLHGITHGEPFAMMVLATALLIATPILRVVVATWTFYRDGDRRYAAICGTVLLVVALTVILSHAGLR